MTYSVDEILKAYEILVKGIEEDASDTERAYGGVVRAGKGKLVESIAKHAVGIAWENLSGDWNLPPLVGQKKGVLKVGIEGWF